LAITTAFIGFGFGGLKGYLETYHITFSCHFWIHIQDDDLALLYGKLHGKMGCGDYVPLLIQTWFSK